ncbi:nitronate monooxygenase family protein [Anaerostipes caccae]|uniref:NAD(P)H-dependent flavin oxidoreductase n=2 Tax=Anaerostipes caccae TaxID=105841 RepID=UPI003013D2BB
MEVKPLKIGDLVAKIPIIQGGMGVGVSLSSLAGAVAKEGGIGVLSAAQIGYDEPDFEKDPEGANMRAMKKHIRKARKIAPDGIIGINIMVATRLYANYVKEAIANGIDLIISGAGLPTELPALAKGSRTKLVPIVSPKKSARVILKMWDKKHQTAPDALLIEGPKAGGHLGFKYEELVSDETYENYDDTIREIIDMVKPYEEKYEKDIPVIVAGGVSSKEDMEHCLSMGASGVQIATPFVTTEECDADIRYKEAYINCKKEDITIVKSPVGMPGRAIKNKFMEIVQREGRIKPKHCFNCMSACNPGETVYCITERLIEAVRGNIDDGLIFCGADAWKCHKISTVKDVIGSYIK